MNAASSEIKRLVYISLVTMVISAGVFSQAGENVAVSFGMADWLRVKRVARRRAADRSFGSSWRPELASTANREPTVENTTCLVRRQVRW